MSERSPTLADVISVAMERKSASLRVCLPGRVEAFDKDTQLADVKPLLTETFENEDGTEATHEVPVISNVPVQFAGGGDFFGTFPVKKGDPCLLVFSDRSIDLWIENGGVQDPVDLRRHDLCDAVAILGVRSKKGKLTEFDADRAVLGKTGGVRLAIGDKVHLGVGDGADGTDAGLLGDTYRGKEDDMLSGISTDAAAIAGFVTAMATALSTAASSNATPIYGGALAAPQFIVIGQLMGQIVSKLSDVVSKISTFQGQASTYLSTKVKLS